MVFTRYHGNSICPEERTDAVGGHPRNMP